MEDNPSSMEATATTTNCLVCDEPRASRHYGSVCCSGCKGFFRRTVRFQRKYECSFDKNCIIRKEFRNCCRACRYDKCIKMGLNPLMVHSDRVGPSTKNSSSESDASTSIVVKIESNYDDEEDKIESKAVVKKDLKKFHSKNNYFEDDYDAEDEYAHWHQLAIQASSRLSCINNMALGSAKIIPEFNSADFSSVVKYYVLVERIIDDFFETDKNHVFATPKDDIFSLNVPVERAFREPRAFSRRSKIDWSCRYFLKSAALNKVWCRIMGHYIDWTSHIPELAKMDSEDQLQLMLARSIPCVWMLVGQRSMSKNNHGISLSGGAYFPTDEEEQKQIDKEILPFLKKVCTWVKEEFMEPAAALELCETEYAILRVLCFFVPVAKLSPHGKDIVRRARHFYRNVLIQHLRSKYPGQEEFVMSRLAELLCFLPIMEIAGRMEDDELSFMTLFNVANMQGELTYEVHVRKSQ